MLEKKGFHIINCNNKWKINVRELENTLNILKYIKYFKIWINIKIIYILNRKSNFFWKVINYVFLLNIDIVLIRAACDNIVHFANKNFANKYFLSSIKF